MPSYSGMWTLQQQMQAVAAGTWPEPPLQGGLWSWGNNPSGQLGVNDIVNRSSPVQVGSEVNWAKISAGQSTPLFVKTDGTLWAVGLNNKGQVGDGNVVSKSSPVQVGALTNWLDVASGGYRGSAIRQDGTLWTWGSNSRGQLGINAAISVYRSSPVQVGSLTTWAKIFAGQGSSFAIKTDGTLWAWGANTFGFLGDSAVVDRSSPVQVGAATDWAHISVADSAAFGIKTNGTLWAWGRNQNGQLGIGVVDPVSGVSSPVQVGALTTWKSVSGSSGDSILAIRTDGTLWAWGVGSSGRLGLNSTTNRSSPVQVGALTTWSKAAAGISSFAIKTDGTLWSWGQNSIGQSGLNDIINRSSPVQVGALNNWGDVNAWGSTIVALIKR